MKFRCSCGSIEDKTWNDFRLAPRCKKCGWEITSIKNSGENNPNWTGGSKDSYCSIWRNKDYKESIKERDNYKCQNPECWYYHVGKKYLVLHHIDYNKLNCHPTNIITVCNSCNTRANFNKEKWEELYSNLMQEKFKKAA